MKRAMPYILTIVFCIIYCTLLARNANTQYIQKYDTAMDYYASERYCDALQIFADIKDYRLRERDGRKMFEVTLQKLREYEDISICPRCGNIIYKEEPTNER